VAARAAVAAVRDAAREVLSALRPVSGGAADDATGLKVAGAAVLALFETAERMAAEDTSGEVLWCARGGAEGPRAGVSRLLAAPLDVSGLIRSRLLGERRAVLTSATLTLGGSFDPLARSVGLDVGEPGGWRGLDVGSPFDYPRQGIVYVARSLPPPTRDGAAPAQLDELASLVDAAGGRTLGLFSSRRAAIAATEALRERLDVRILCQGEDQLPTLVREFVEEEEACLFGTLALWQGVDVPGATCRLVVIDRIPFPRPDDPVRSARAEAVDRAGGSGFMAVSATHAALLLAQGAGRLIRTATDRGVVAVLDPRLVTARYGEFLAESLPPLWRTTEGDVTRAALRRLAAS
jgi:ATP-dependent DNA helicase DinG